MPRWLRRSLLSVTWSLARKVSRQRSGGIRFPHSAVQFQHRIEQIHRGAAVTFREPFIDLHAAVERPEGSFEIDLLHHGLLLVRGRRNQDDLLYFRILETADQGLHAFGIDFQSGFTVCQILRIRMVRPVAVAVHIVHAEEHIDLVRLEVEQIKIHSEERPPGGISAVAAVEGFQVDSRVTGEIVVADKAVIGPRVCQTVS